MMQKSLLTQLRFLRIKQTRLAKNPPTETEIEAAENALDDWQEFKNKIDAFDSDLHHGCAKRRDLLDMTEKGNNDVINALASVLEDAPNAVVTVLTQAELDHVERDYYHVLMT